MKIVTKRDGRKEQFDKEKIIRAIQKAFIAIDGDVNEYATSKAKEIANDIANKDTESYSVEDIQDQIENSLMASKRKDVAKKYIVYRNERTKIREHNTVLIRNIKEKLSASNVQNQNANVDEYSFGGRKGEADSELMRKIALDDCVSAMARENHLNNEIYIHDLDSYAVGMHNCLSIPFDKLLANGFNTRQTDVRPAKSINTAFQLVAVIFQLQSLQQFGGVSATHLDWTMVPYVRISFSKHFKDGLKYCEDINEPLDWVSGELSIGDERYKEHEKTYRYALDQTTKETYQAVEGMYHNLNTLQSRSGNQLPFTSVNYGTCTLEEGRLVTKALLEVSIKGVGKLHKTAIFPCGIFQCMKGVNRKPGDPNYDLFQLALKSTAQRLYPNYANVDWSGNAGYDREDPRTYFSTMGCVDGDEIITYRYHGALYVESFERMWNRLSDNFEVKVQNDGSGKNLYINLVGVEIFDTENGFVNTKRLIRNLSEHWLDVNFSNGRRILCTTDHPFEVIGKGAVRADQLVEGDTIRINSTQYSDDRVFYDVDKAWLMGFLLCDGCYANGHIFASINFEGEDDIQNKFIYSVKKCFGLDVDVIEQHRGAKGDYKDLYIASDGTETLQKVINYLVIKFGGVNKKSRHIPNDVFEWTIDAKLAFLAGMIDADGYINNNKDTVIQIGSTNKELALQQLALAQAAGMPAKLYYNHYRSNKKDCIRYRIEFKPMEDLLDFIVCEKKLDHYEEPVNIGFNTEASVREVSAVARTAFSYDVTTDSEHFEVSGIYSHNCRTANGWDINGFGQLKDGRGNICPVTIILPTIAMEAHEQAVGTDIVSAFMTLLDKKIDEAKEMLIERFNWICSQSPQSARFMYENGLMEGYIPEEGIRSALKHGTLALGQIGLAETLQILVGCDHTEERGMELAKKIEALFKTRCAEYKEKYKLNFGVYYSPSENLCYTSMNKFKKKYGEIPKVSDRKFFTNSMHVPVWKQMSPFEKIDIESQLTGFSSAGCITYVELDAGAKNNIEALETIVNYAMDKDVPYFAINVPNDTCLECGYTDEIGEVCPECGGYQIQRLRRVTGLSRRNAPQLS